MLLDADAHITKCQIAGYTAGSCPATLVYAEFPGVGAIRVRGQVTKNTQKPLFMMHIGVRNRGLVGHFSWFCDLEALREEKRPKWPKRPFDTEMDPAGRHKTD